MSQDCLLLADDMGLGKTVQSITALRRLLAAAVLGQVLVVAPVSLLTQWRRELLAWAPEVSAIRVEGSRPQRAWKWQAKKHVYLASYDVVRSDMGVLLARHWDLVILDEAQRIKNRDAGLSRACKRLSRKRAWALTGTPLENREDELASVLEFVRPNPEGKSLPRLHFGPRLLSLHAEVQLRRRKVDVLTELPPKRVVRLPLELTPPQRQLYRELEAQGRGELVGLGPAATVMHVLEMIMRLKQVCNFCPRTGSSSKLENLRERLRSLVEQGDRALIFSQWTHAGYGVERLAQELAEFHPLTYTGALSSAERQVRVEAFRQGQEHKALILSLRAGGLGLNLQEASYVVHFDRWWNPAVENQATDRSHRMGQKRAVTVYAYTCVDTIEERIEQILDKKRHLFACLVDGVSLDVRRLLTPEELFGLFGLPAPVRAPATFEETLPSLVERVRRLLVKAGWEVGEEGEARFCAHRLDEVCLRQQLEVFGNVPTMLSNPGAGSRLLVLPHRPGRGELAQLEQPNLTVWGPDELSRAERAVGLSLSLDGPAFAGRPHQR